MRHHYAEVLALEILIAAAEREITSKPLNNPYSFFQGFALAVEESRDIYSETCETRGISKKVYSIAGKHTNKAFNNHEHRQIYNNFSISMNAIEQAQLEVGQLVNKIFNFQPTNQ
ncbi:MAG: hypothetical protein OXC62_05620 [Aestuariivita sp.]|nr:hypothetical protein [Aestuariivita sp.]